MMNTRRGQYAFLFLALSWLLGACGAQPTLPAISNQAILPATTLAQTPAPTWASLLPKPGVRVAVRAPDQSIRVVDTGVPLDPINSPTAGGVMPIGGASHGTIYVLNEEYLAHPLAVDGRETRLLAFVLDANSLAVSPGEPTSLSWGLVALTGDKVNTVLWASNADGTRREALLIEEVGGMPNPYPYQIVAQRWSRDGRAIYFSKEPYGIGGYLPLRGASSWYRIDVAERAVTELIPFRSNGRQSLCIDDFSPDERLIAEHYCSDSAITVLDLTTQQSTQIQPPSDSVGFRALGSARFNANATRVAFALAKHDPDDEQGGIAVSVGLSGTSQLIATSQPGEYFTIAGWLNDGTLLVQLNHVLCTPACATALWTMTINDGQLTKIADGSFVAILN